MARPRSKAKEKPPQSSLAVAIEFIKAAQVNKDTDVAHMSHCRIANGFAVAFDGVVAMGHPVEEVDLSLCPQTHKLGAALSRCKSALSITQMANNSLSIRSGSFRAVIPCLNPAALPFAGPDPRVGDLTPDIQEGFALLNPIIRGAGTTVVESSLLLNNNSMVATDRNIMVEYWHGVNLPDGLVIPKVAVTAVARIKSPPVGIGVGHRTVTFWYDNGAWLRTQLYGEEWPDIKRVIDRGDKHACNPPPPAMYEAVAATLPHSADGAVHFTDKGVASHSVADVGSSYELGGLPSGVAFSGALLLEVEKYANVVDLAGVGGVSYFFGDRTRGALAQRR